MSFVLNHLRGHILQCSTESSSLLAVITLYAPSKVTNFDDVSFFYKDVFRLNISMNKTLFVHIINTRAYLDEKVESCILTQILLSSDQVKQVAFARILKGQVDGVSIFKRGVESADVLVIELLLNSDLTYESFFDFRGS